MSLANFCNTCWMASCLPEARAYVRDSRDVAGAQAKLLRQIVQHNRDTVFGRDHRFDAIENVRDFQNAVPLSTYDDYRDAINRIADGEQNVLTAEPIRLLEPTGGSSSGEKLIPYTATLQQSFQRAIRTWIWNLYSTRPAVRRGRAYWSISPLSQIGRRTTAGILVGFDDDAAYLGHFERRLAAKVIVAPRELALCPSVAAAQYATLFFLLRAPDLSFISVWSPTFLTELLKLLWARREALCDDIACGQIAVDQTAEESAVTQRQYPPLADRAEYLRRVFRDAEDISQCVPSIWPSLALVSCWADGPSLVHSNNLRRYLPGIELQPKGLLATEAFVTVPFVSLDAPALAIRSHFFEFQPADFDPRNRGMRPLLAHELAAGDRYQVTVTTGGGLYRYQLHDEVEVVSFHSQVPLLRFLGKTDETSDLVGEKLNAAHVQSVLQTVFRDLRLTPIYSQLRPLESSPPGYALQIVAPSLVDAPHLQRQLRDAVELGFHANPAYRYARSLGQLGALELELLDEQEADAQNANRTTARIAAGQRLGDIKPSTIMASQG